MFGLGSGDGTSARSKNKRMPGSLFFFFPSLPSFLLSSLPSIRPSFLFLFGLRRHERSLHKQTHESQVFHFFFSFPFSFYGSFFRVRPAVFICSVQHHVVVFWYFGAFQLGGRRGCLNSSLMFISFDERNPPPPLIPLCPST